MIKRIKNLKASILIVTMMILGIVLTSAMSIAIVSLKERRTSIGTGKSNQSYQTADTGIEQVMSAILTNRAVGTKTGNDLGLPCVNGKITGTGYVVELKKNDGTNDVTALCTDNLADIVAIKSVGTGGGTQRAIEAAIGVCKSGSYPIDNNPVGIAFDNLTKSIWVINREQNPGSVSKLNNLSGVEVGDYVVGNSPNSAVFDDATDSIWVVNELSDNVTKLNVNTGGEIGVYPVGDNPNGIAFDSATNSVWVANGNSNNVTKLNANTGIKIGDYTAPNTPNSLAFDSATNSIWVVMSNSSKVRKLNANTGAQVGTDYEVGNNPGSIAFDSATNSIWVASRNSNNVRKLNVNTGAKIDDYPVGTNPVGITFDDVTDSIWVVNKDSNNVTKLDANTGAKIGDYVVGNNPNSIAFDSVTESVWVVNGASNTVNKICVKSAPTPPAPPPPAPSSCNLPWGGTIADGASVTAYQSGGTLPACSVCSSQTRVCSNGVLSGSYTNQSCLVANCSLGYACFGGSTCSACQDGCCAYIGSACVPGTCTGNFYCAINGDVCGLQYDAVACPTAVDCTSNCGSGQLPGTCGFPPRQETCVCQPVAGCASNVCKFGCI